MDKSPSPLDVKNALGSTYDPEVGIDIVSLGLIYDVKVSAKGDVSVKMTMTSQMCPFTGEILDQVQMRLEHLPGVGKVKVELVWEPPWNPSMMSEEQRAKMGV